MFSSIIAGLSLLLSISLAIFYFRDRRQAKFLIENDYINRLLDWHAEVVILLISLRESCTEENDKSHCEKLSLLSAKIEQGRFFFPNIDRGDSLGMKKPPAYRGYRNLALDFLVASYNLFREDMAEKDLNHALMLQRHFTSIVFEIVRPENRLSTIKDLTDRFFVQEKSFEDFLSNKDNSIIEYIWKK